MRSAFVSLNYDLLLDSPLVNLYPRFDLDYGIEFKNFQPWCRHRGERWRRPQPDGSVQLLKLHGSLNWLYCPICNMVELTPKEKGVALAKYVRCQTCKSDQQPVLVLPTWERPISIDGFRPVSTVIERAIRKCSRICFLGYSLPAYDIDLRYMLRKFTIERPERDRPEVFLALVHEDSTREPREDTERYAEKIARYTRFFGEDQVIDLNVGFQSFVERLSELVDIA